MNNPPTTHDEIIEFAKAIGAGSIDFDLDIQIFASIAEAAVAGFTVDISQAIDFVDFLVNEIEDFTK